MVNSRSLPRAFFSRLFSRKNTGSHPGEDLALRQVNALKEPRKFPSFSQIRQLPHILSPQEKKIFTGGIVTFCMGIFFLLLGSLFFFFTSVPRAGGTLTEGVLGYPQLINPLYADANTVDREISALVYSGLLTYDPTTQSLAPQLAESWSLSEDEKTYTVTLKQGISWQDGEPFSANDILFTYAALQNPVYGSPLLEAYRNVVLTQIDERTVSFTLPEPYAAFPELLTLGILPAHLWEEIPPANARITALNLKPVGTGPYILQKTSKDTRGTLRSISLRVNKAFSGTHPYLDEIVIKFYPSAVDLTRALQTKRIDTTAALSFRDILALQGDTSLTITPFPLAQYVGAFFNTKKTLLSEDVLRKALTLSLNIPQITADATGNLGVPSGFALPGFPPTAASVQDTQTAGSLLDGLGWTMNESGKRTKDGTELALTLTTAERPELVRAAQSIAAAWQNMGIAVTVQTLNGADIVTALKEKNYDVLIAAEQYGVIADPYPFWHASAKGGDGLNMSQFSTAATDAAVITLRTSSNPEKRTEAFTSLSQEFIDHMPAVFLFENVLPLVHTVDILGISPEPIPTLSARWNLENMWYRHTGLSWKF